MAGNQRETLPAPSKGCQMVPKGCQFTIPYGLMGTPLKVQVGFCEPPPPQKKKTSWWLNQPSEKYARQIGNHLPQKSG